MSEATEIVAEIRALVESLRHATSFLAAYPTIEAIQLRLDLLETAMARDARVASGPLADWDRNLGPWNDR